MKAVYFDFGTPAFEIFDGKKLKIVKDLPKWEDETVITDSLNKSQIQKLLHGRNQVWRCAEQSVDHFQEQQGIEARSTAIAEMYKATPRAFRECKIEPLIAAYFDNFRDYQKMRIASGNRLFFDTSDVMEEFNATMKKGEEQLKKIVEDELGKYAVYNQWLLQVKGIGPSLAGGLVAYLGNCERFRSVSALWAYAGLHCVDDGNGKFVAAKRTKGQESNWNQKLKSHCWLLASQLLKNKCPTYADLYYQQKEKSLAKGLTAGHAHNQSLRKVAKVFLSHYWHVARTLAGLDTRSLWIIEHGGHQDVIAPPFWNGKEMK